LQCHNSYCISPCMSCRPLLLTTPSSRVNFKFSPQLWCLFLVLFSYFSLYSLLARYSLLILRFSEYYFCLLPNNLRVGRTSAVRRSTSPSWCKLRSWAGTWVRRSRTRHQDIGSIVTKIVGRKSRIHVQARSDFYDVLGQPVRSRNTASCKI